MERESLHEIHPSSSSLPGEPDFSMGRSRPVIDSQESNEFPPRSSALCQMRPWCDSAQNNPLAPRVSLLFAPAAWSSSPSVSPWRRLRDLFPSLLPSWSNCASRIESYFRTFEKLPGKLPLYFFNKAHELFFFFIYDCGNNSTWVIQGWRWTFATPRAEQCSYHCFTALVSLFL